MKPTMTYTYSFVEPDETCLLRDNQDGTFTFITVNSGSAGWQEYIFSGATAASYVEPPAPPEPTPEEKLARSGLTVDELKGLLGLGG